jgi:hypothetical protein
MDRGKRILASGGPSRKNARVSTSSADEEFNLAIRRLWDRRTYAGPAGDITVAMLVRAEDWLVLDAPWWKGKEVCIIGVDLGGNFLLRHSDGSVRYWDHATQSEALIAPGVRQFIRGLS